MSPRIVRSIALAALVSGTLALAIRHDRSALAQGAPAGFQGGGRGGRGGGRGAGPTGQATATSDLTGYWVRLVTEDWRWLMAVPAKGNSDSIGLSPAGTAALNAWDPARDEAEGNQCKGYGAGAISRLPTRAHVTWQDANTLKWETDQGMQTRLFKFGAAEQTEANPGPRTWQGVSIASWEPTAGGGRGGIGGFPGGGPPAGGPAPAPGGNAAGRGGRGGNQNGWLKVVTTHVKPGYLRKNGVPYGEKATITEYFQPTPETYGAQYMIVTTIVEDPEFLSGTWITSSNYKKLPDTNNGWDPQPCSAR
ncbi:MAG TPA: hypothetical protein VFY29_02830 [Terriglobia bacterium]|nr:hypothetical protein [Terriglobia bacterium]